MSSHIVAMVMLFTFTMQALSASVINHDEDRFPTDTPNVLSSWNESNVSSSNHSDHHQGGGHGIHVAKWNFEHVKEPLIITVAVLIAGLCKMGKTLILVSSSL